MNAFHSSLQQAFGIQNDELPIIGSYFKQVDFSKDEFLLKQHHHCDFMLFVQNGYVRQYSVNGNKEITQWIGPPNYFITEISSFLFGTKSRFNLQCLTPVSGLKIAKTDYLKLAREFPNWADIEKQFIAHCFIALEERVGQFITLSAEDRYLAFFEHNKELFHTVPQQYLASMLGMSPETLSRIRAKHIS